ncbi:hypothetical protein [Fundidesulfovibrio terrae]|uniref:hypothetical protein n=1 Tax=Fundidesulfovibrio terrae TaxID=2922866 RepID=UPI001FB04A7D|nr:hypothetical protein [Fundidesulfovibrio terrae]
MLREKANVRWASCFGTLALACVLAGCSIKNHGAVSYVEGKFPSQSSLVQPGVTDAGALVLPGKDTVSIFLRKAYINRFPELAISQKKKRGEIAIVARVTEIGPGRDVDYTQQAVNNGRLVFYGDDVRQGQVLNTFFAPVCLPRKYEGGMLLLQVFILELDKTPPWVKPLLHMLATAGALNSPQAAPALKMLDSLGSTLISDRHDDTIFTFTMTFLPVGADERLHPPLLSAGHFALVRDESRDPAKHLDKKLVVDEGGELVWKESLREYLDDSFVVFQVQKGLKAMPADFKDTTFGDYLKVVKEAYDAESKKYADLVDDLLAQYETAQNLNRVKNEMNALGAASKDQVQARTLWATDLVDQTVDLIAKEEACKAAASKAKKGDCPYSKQVDQLLSGMKRLLAGTDSATSLSRADFKDSAKVKAIRVALIGAKSQ